MSMIKSWHGDSWDDYLEWHETDHKVWKKINRLVKDTERTPFSGIGKPEPLKGNLSGCWSRRITAEHRLIYRVRDNVLEILSCMGHYED